MKIGVVGTGYVGLVAGACLADTGHDVVCQDINPDKIKQLENGEIPIYEPGLKDLVARNHKRRLNFTTSIKDLVENTKVIFIAVGTPQDEDGSADLSHVLAVAKDIGRYMNEDKVVVDKSTVPVGTAKLVEKAINSAKGDRSFKVSVVSNPEFLKEGAAIQDFMVPDRVVVGVDDKEAEKVMQEIYAPFVRTNHPILVMDVASAELTKYAANAMLAARISFMNELSNLCQVTGADIEQVRKGIGTDSRIGMSFLFPGIGYGGSCFPKDVQALIRSAKDYDIELSIANATELANERQKKILSTQVKNYFKDLKGKKIAIWGLAFKPKTDDTREAPALEIVKDLYVAGASLNLYDPVANHTFKERLDKLVNCEANDNRVQYFSDNMKALEGCDALVVCTEWNEFRKPDFGEMKSLLRAPVVFDGRNIYSPAEMSSLKFNYFSIGRNAVMSAGTISSI